MSHPDDEIDSLLARGRLSGPERERQFEAAFARARAPARRRWLMLAPALAACAAVLVLVVRPGGFRARGGAGGPSVEVVCRTGESDRCRSGELLLFRVEGLSGRAHVTAWAEPVGGGTAIRYFPAAPAEVSPRPGPQILGDGVRIGAEQPPGSYLIHLSLQPVEGQAVERTQRMEILPLRLLALLMMALPALAAPRTYVIAVGNNAPPIDSDGESLEPLRYADDDAADFFSFTRGLAQRSFLLSVLDAESQQRFPALSAEARRPTLAELERVIELVRQLMEEDLRQGNEPVLLFFFSGHGTRGGDQPPSLALLDGPLTQEILYQRVLAPLPARYVHMFVDACHAEAVVRPRDASAETVRVSPEDVRAYATRATLDRFPHVGAVVATASANQSHEWDVYQRGVFSHEVLSGLRGAADVNGDGLVEYSELHAFLAAANREVADPRARLEVVVRPPSLNQRAPLVDLRGAPHSAHLFGRPSDLGPMWVEDARGNRLVDLHAEAGADSYVTLPAGEPLFLHAGDRREASFALRDGESLRFEQLRLGTARQSARGALEASLWRGLFRTMYGPLYYRGFIARDGESAAVPLDQPGALTTTLEASLPPRRRSRAGVALVASGAALAAAGVVLAGLTAAARSDYQNTSLERPAREARDRYYDFQAAAGVTLGVGLAGAAVGTLLLARHR